MANLFIKLSNDSWGYTCHDQREYDAILSGVPYLHDRCIHVLVALTTIGHDPYCLWGYRPWGSQNSLHKKAKAYDICDNKDLHRRGGTGWNTTDSFKADRIIAATIYGFYSGVNWYSYGRPFGDWAHMEWRGKMANLSQRILALGNPHLVAKLLAC